MVAITYRPSGAALAAETKPEWEDFVHTGPGTLAGRYLRMFWHPVCRAHDVKPGWTKPIRLMGEDFTLYRGESGTPHLVAFRCAHRGTQLTAGWVEGDDLRCYYHGWKYDATGQCIEQPGEREPFCQRIRIASYSTEEYLGLIFVYVGEGEAPVFPRYSEIEREEGVLENWLEELPCNYFNRLDNAADSVHVPFVHSNRNGKGARIPMNLQARETDYGMTCEDHSESRVARDRSGWQRRPSMFHMPNMNLMDLGPKNKALEIGSRTAVMWRVPIDDVNHIVIGAQRVKVFGENVQTYLEQLEEQQLQHADWRDRRHPLVGLLQRAGLSRHARAGRLRPSRHRASGQLRCRGHHDPRALPTRASRPCRGPAT
ncbi:MAG: hypothetical protein HW416_1751 [Chloroflexi bacterium]|nr:hypothetical protein [Chloroflexota bacterium]